MDELSDRLGVHVEPVEVGSYGELRGQLAEGRLDGGILAPFDYVQADAVLDLHLVATPVVAGQLSYHSYVVVLEDQPVRRVRGLGDLEGGPIGFVHEGSASGWAFPAVMFLDAGLDPNANARFLGSHHGVLAAVREGSVLGGAVYGGLVQGSPFEVVAKSPPIPNDAWVLRGDLPEEVAQAMAVALNQVDSRTEQGRNALGGLRDVNGFVPVEPSHYDGVREVHRRLQGSDR